MFFACVVLFVTCWAFFEARPAPTPKADAALDATRVVALLFSSGLTICYWWTLWTDSEWWHLLNSAALGYFVWDLGVCVLLYDKIAFTTWLHALLCTFLYFRAVFYGSFCHDLAVMLVVETSTPFLNLMLLSQTRRWLSARSTLVVTALFLSTFVILRLVWSSYFLLWVLWPELWNEEQHIGVLALVYLGLNYWWCFRLVQRFVVKNK